MVDEGERREETKQKKEIDRGRGGKGREVTEQRRYRTARIEMKRGGK